MDGVDTLLRQTGSSEDGAAEVPAPAELLDAFASGNPRLAEQALERYAAVADKTPFREQLLKRLGQERHDGTRAWIATALADDGDPACRDALLAFVRGDALPAPPTRGQRRAACYTRLFCLRGLDRLAATPQDAETLHALLQTLVAEPDEDPLVSAAASLLLATRYDDESQLPQVEATIRAYGSEFRGPRCALRALREFPHRALRDAAVDALRNSRYTDHRLQAIRALGGFPGDRKAVTELCEVAEAAPDSFLRLEAVVSLGRVGHPDSLPTLLRALRDDNAEVRVQAADALLAVVADRTRAVQAIVERALSAEALSAERELLLDAVRRLDGERSIAAELLRKEMSSEDQARVRVAEAMLISLGGWAAVQRLSQRRTTLQELDSLLRQSEDVVKETFRDTITQARRNFYFAMVVNIAVFVLGIAFVAIAMKNVVGDPERFSAWVLPGATGVLGILVSMFFNDPRRHAREDLTALMNVNVIFLGFLRQVNQIDATFKHAFMEQAGFGPAQMKETVAELEHAVATTLAAAQAHLGAAADPKAAAGDDASEAREPAPVGAAGLAH